MNNSCSNCQHLGLWTKLCYKSESGLDPVTGAKILSLASTHRAKVCQGAMFLEKKHVPDLKFSCNNLLER